MESKADIYFKETLREILMYGEWDEKPRPKWSDGTPAHSKFITQKSYTYRIDKGELPLISLRKTAIKGGWNDIEAIYLKQTNLIEQMHPSIQPWWTPFVTKIYPNSCRSIGQTYGNTVARYDLLYNLLEGMKNNPFGRRHILSLWQNEQMEDDPRALVPCAYKTAYSLSRDKKTGGFFVDMTLDQRSMDYLMTASINPMQYVMFGMAVCGHLQYETGVKYTLRKFKHDVQNVHIYDRHMFAISELLSNVCTNKKATISLKTAKPIYDYTFEDFDINIPFEAPNLSQKLEIAI